VIPARRTSERDSPGPAGRTSAALTRVVWGALLAATLLPLAIGGSAATSDRAAVPPVRRIFIAGGGLFSDGPDHRLLRYILTLTGKADPVVCCLPTASGDNLERLVAWYEIMNTLPCRPRHLRLFGPTGKARSFEKQLLAADAILVPGGNGLNMLSVWKAQEVDAVLRTAWDRGIVLAGESAGMNCWFEQGVGDSLPERLSVIDFLGWLKGSACAHYHAGREWKRRYHEMLGAGQIQDGIACDDGAGVLFEGDKVAKVVSTRAQATAYRVFRKSNEVIEEALKAELLEKRPN
jgi:dipeptidase E